MFDYNSGCFFLTNFGDFLLTRNGYNRLTLTLSYNNEGLMSVEDIQTIMSKYGKYDLAQTDYQRFKADASRFNKADSTVEYLHILEKQ